MTSPLSLLAFLDKIGIRTLAPNLSKSKVSLSLSFTLFSFGLLSSLSSLFSSLSSLSSLSFFNHLNECAGEISEDAAGPSSLWGTDVRRLLAAIGSPSQLHTKPALPPRPRGTRHGRVDFRLCRLRHTARSPRRHSHETVCWDQGADSLSLSLTLSVFSLSLLLCVVAF